MRATLHAVWHNDPCRTAKAVMKQPTVQRLTLIVRLRTCQTAKDWCGQVELVNPHREAVFRNRDELWNLMETWAASQNPSKDEHPNEQAEEGERTTSQ